MVFDLEKAIFATCFADLVDDMASLWAVEVMEVDYRDGFMGGYVLEIRTFGEWTDVV
jgi:hypothetical protein